MQKLYLSGLIGFIVFALGLANIYAWYAHIPLLISLIPGGIATAINSGLCLAIAGAGLFLAAFFPAEEQQFLTVTGTLLITFAILVLSQDIFNYSSGIDQILIKPWLLDGNPHPGRMGNSTSFAYILVGMSYLMIPRTHTLFKAFGLQIVLFSIIAMGVSALLGYFIKLEFLYDWYRYRHMAINTSITIILLGIGLWLLWSYHEKKSLLYAGHEDKKILLVSGFILIAIVSITVLTTFGIYVHLSEKVFQPTLQHFLLNRSEKTSNAIIENQFFQSLRQQFQLVLPLFLLAILLGILLLSWQVVPLVRKVILSERRAQARKNRLIESENRFRSAFDNAAIGMALVSPEGKWLKVNEALCKITGYTQEELLESDIQSITHPEDLEKTKNYMNRLLNQKANNLQLEKRYFHKNGNIIWVLKNISLIKDHNDKPRYFIAQIQNINLQKTTELQLKYLAYHDPLTNLYNRTHLEESVKHSIEVAKRYKQIFALLIIDLDNFKQINDTLGHDAGDFVLKAVAYRLKACIRASDITGRLGGDEFAIALLDIKNIETMILLAKKILLKLQEVIRYENEDLFVTSSMGISIYPSDGCNYTILMKNADIALYRAKENGRNNYQLIDPNITNETLQAKHKPAGQNIVSLKADKKNAG